MFLSVKLNYKCICRRGFVYKWESLLGMGFSKLEQTPGLLRQSLEFSGFGGFGWAAPCPPPLRVPACFVCLPPVPCCRREMQRPDLKIESRPLEDGETSVCLGGASAGMWRLRLGRMRGFSGASGTTRGCWRVGDRPHMTAGRCLLSRGTRRACGFVAPDKKSNQRQP